MMRAGLPLTTLLAALLAGGAVPIAAQGLAYGPFDGASMIDGGQGYQELPLAPGRWYVAYQGNRRTAPEWVAAGWAARSAQLCAGMGAAQFVELHYPFEPVTAAAAATMQGDPQPSRWAMRHAAAAYVPIAIPSAPPAVVALRGPSKMAAVQCVANPSALKDPRRAVAVSASLEAARRLGMALPK